MAMSKNPQVIMTERQFVERLEAIRNRKTFYKNKYPYNLCYINKDGRTSADCVNLLKAILNGYNIFNNTVGYYQKDLTNTGDCTELELLKQCQEVSQNFTSLTEHAEILYMKGHVGAYIGKTIEGKYNTIECTKSFGGGVVFSWVDSDGTRRNQKDGVKNGKWKQHGLMTKWVKYLPIQNPTQIQVKPDYSKYPVLKKGSKGEYVKILQRLLLSKGYDPKGIDGQFGNNTLIAVKNFQKTNTDINGKKLIVDGYVGQKTWGSLYK